MVYTSVSISGPPKSGKTILNNSLTKALGWESYSFGGFLRQIHAEEGARLLFEDWYRLQDVDRLRQLNQQLGERASRGGIIVDTRFAHFLGPQTYRVYVEADLEIRIQRARKAYLGKSDDEIRQILKQREEDELGFGRKIWGPKTDYRHPDIYHSILHSDLLTPEQEHFSVMAALTS